MLKADAAAIRQFMADLKRAPWLGPARSWWPDCLFRTDHVEAAATILNSGKLLSRAKAAGAGAMVHDSAAPDVIGVTADRWKEYVRLYFRPRSPTQYNSEGFRPRQYYSYNCHCPMPVVFVLDAEKVLTREDSQFSNGNLASNAQVGRTAEFLANIPFQTVYHDTWFTPEERGTIIFHRHAEVIVPNEMDLDAVRFIGCRTQAEYQTLLHLLTPAAAVRWSRRIGLGVKANLHYRHWNFVEEANLDSKGCVFSFNPSPKVAGPFDVRAELVEETSGKTYHWRQEGMTINKSVSIGLQNLEHPERYTVQLMLDGRIAYANRFAPDDLPF